MNMRFLIIICFCLLPVRGLCDDWNVFVDLRGQWKFELGDDMKWSDQKFDDGKWAEIFVPSPWEDEGYAGYDGYAWYRKHFRVPEVKHKALYLLLGSIDDVDEVYVNGHFVGFSGSFPPDFYTSYERHRVYWLPVEYLNQSGDNVIAVRIYDIQLVGGIVSGRIGIFEPKDFLWPDAAFPAVWKFKTGDDKRWKDPKTDDGSWQSVHVPSFWETQGFKNYNGFGWYMVSFRVPEELKGQRLVLLLGKIDDIDEAYINGELVGKTGRIYERVNRMSFDDEYLQQRAYPIPSDLLNPDGDNVLAVRVYDTFLHGGIYDGPVGLITRDRYTSWRKTQKKAKGDFWDFFNSLFDR